MPIVHLASLDEPGLQVFGGRTDAQLRDGVGAGDPGGLFVAESMNVIERALDAGVRLVSLFVEQSWYAHETPLVERVAATHPEAPIYVATHEQFRELTGYQVTRGALAAFRRPPERSVAELVAQARRVAILEDVTNYANIGQMFRSAAALGMDAVLVSPRCHDPLYRRAARVSMGTVFQVPWTRVDEKRDGKWPADVLSALRRDGFTVLSLALTPDALHLDDPRLAGLEKVVLVLGTEGAGLDASTIQASDHAVVIPMHAHVDSLNVGAAAAVAMWELRARTDRLHTE